MTDGPDDLHVIPTAGVPHREASDCHCGPRVDDGAPKTAARLWVHNVVDMPGETIDIVTGMTDKECRAMLRGMLTRLTSLTTAIGELRPGRMGKGDGAIDVAITLLREQRAALAFACKTAIDAGCTADVVEALDALRIQHNLPVED